MKIRAVVVLAVAGLVVASCSSEGGPPQSRREYADVLTGELQQPIDVGFDFGFDEERARCLAAAFVGVIGFEQLRRVEPEALLNTDFDELGISLHDRRDDLEEAIANCGWLDQLIVDTVSNIADVRLSGETVRCIVADGGDEISALLLDDTISGDSSRVVERAVTDLLGVGFSACPEAFTEIFIASLESGGVTVAPGGEECIADQARSHPAEVAELIESPEKGEAFGEQIAMSCGAFFRGARPSA